MGDLLRQGAQWLGDMLKQHASSPVTYRRPSTGSGQATEALIDATFGRTACEVEDARGLRVGAEVTDFLVPAEAFSAMFGEPEAGDQVIADGVVYEVMDLAGQGHWRWSDPYRTTMRIHTKQVSTE